MQWEDAQPIPGHEAFDSADPVAVHSQAAFLLLLARPRLDHSFASQGEVDSDLARPGDIVADDAEDEELLDVPDLAGAAVADLATARMRRLELRAADSVAVPATEAGDVAGLVRALYDNPGAGAAVGLIQACLDAPDPLVRVAAAAADLHLDFRAQDLMAGGMPLLANTPYSREPLLRAAAAESSATVAPTARIFGPARLVLPGRATEVLVGGAGDQDELVRDVAVSALEGALFHLESQTVPTPRGEEPPDDSGGGRTGSPSAPKDRHDRHFSIVVHGTKFGPPAGWWRPGRVFPKFLRAEVARNLYAGRRPFYWPGNYSHSARELGAGHLAAWVNEHGPLDQVFAHSHGGSVAMLASQRGVRMNKLVLLSCPVHNAYAPAFNYIRNVVSVRTRLDLVILADGGRQRFRDSRIGEHVLPLWFSHKATRQPEVWRRHRIAAIL